MICTPWLAPWGAWRRADIFGPEVTHAEFNISSETTGYGVVLRTSIHTQPAR